MSGVKVFEGHCSLTFPCNAICFSWLHTFWCYAIRHTGTTATASKIFREYVGFRMGPPQCLQQQNPEYNTLKSTVKCRCDKLTMGLSVFHLNQTLRRTPSAQPGFDSFFSRSSTLLHRRLWEDEEERKSPFHSDWPCGCGRTGGTAWRSFLLFKAGAGFVVWLCPITPHSIHQVEPVSLEQFVNEDFRTKLIVVFLFHLDVITHKTPAK